MMENLDTAGQEKIWYYQKEDGAKYGPYTDEELKRLIVNGILSSDDLIWMVDFDSWIRIGDSIYSVYLPEDKDKDKEEGKDQDATAAQLR
jgi:hypothetical protein